MSACANHSCLEEIELTELDTTFLFDCHERLDCWWGGFAVPSSRSVENDKSRYMYLTMSESGPPRLSHVFDSITVSRDFGR